MWSHLVKSRLTKTLARFELLGGAIQFAPFVLFGLIFFAFNVPLSSAGYSDHVHLKNTSFCLNSMYRSNNGNVDVYTCNGSDPDMDWSFEGDLVRLKGTSYCLNTPYRANNGNVFLWSCNSSDPDQKWEWSGSNLRLKGTNYCLNTPYRYNNGNVFLWSCSGSDGDQQWEKGSVAPGPCPGSGLYCGGSVGQNSNYLYSCSSQGANPQLSQSCANGCQVNPPGTADACIQGPCPSGGSYCGGSVGQNPSNLYSCSSAGAFPQQSEVCANGCQVNPPGTADACIQGPCPSGGSYCGGSVGQNPSNLYSCSSAGAFPQQSQVCANGCQVNPPGTADACIQGPCPSSGLYCGSSVGQNANTLYSCSSTGAIPQQSQVCANGCQVNPPGTADACIQGACPSGGDYCGTSVGGDTGKLYTCSSAGAIPTVKEVCSNGCQVNPPGTADVCTPADFCQTVTWGGAGPYCNGNTLVTCSSNKTTVTTQTCGSGCQTNPPGTPDSCATASSNFCQTVTWGRAGPYCNGNTLVNCSANKEKLNEVFCSNGCQTNPPGTPDSCINENICQTVAWGGAGPYCNGNTLVNCSADKVVIESIACAQGCQVNPPGTPDECVGGNACALVDWYGAGDYCYGSTLVSCNSAKQLTNSRVCNGGCQKSPPNVRDICVQSSFCQQVEWFGPGTYCNGTSVVTCNANRQAVDAQACSFGCQYPVSAPAGLEGTSATSSDLSTSAVIPSVLGSQEQLLAPSNMTSPSIPCGWPNSAYKKVGWGCDPDTAGQGIEVCPSDRSGDSFCPDPDNHTFNAVDIWGEFDVYSTIDGTAYRCVDSTTQQSTGNSYGVFVVVENSQGYAIVNAHLAPDSATDYSLPASSPFGSRCGNVQSSSIESKRFSVTKGQYLGRTALTGKTTDLHLHYEVRTAVSEANRVCPASYMDYSNPQCGTPPITTPLVAGGQCTNDLCSGIASWGGAGNYCYGNALIQCSANKTTVSGYVCSNRCRQIASNNSICTGSAIVPDDQVMVFPIKDWGNSKIEYKFGYAAQPSEWKKQCEPYSVNKPGTRPPSPNNNNLYHGGIDIIHKDALGTEEVYSGSQSEIEKCERGGAGFEIVAVADGIVTEKTDTNEGTRITISHDKIKKDNKIIYSVYMHLDPDEDFVSQGQTVIRGKTIGKIATSARNVGTSNPHIHFELRTTSTWGYGYSNSYPDTDTEGYINPCKFIPEHGGRVPLSCANIYATPGGSMSWGQVSLNLPSGAVNTDANLAITELFDTEQRSIDSSTQVVGSQYDISLFDSVGQGISQLGNSGNLTFSYVRSYLAFIIGQPVVSTYNTILGVWEGLTSIFDPENQTVTAPVTHFSTYALTGATSTKDPASYIATIPSQNGVQDSMNYTTVDVLGYTPQTGVWEKIVDGTAFNLDSDTNIRAHAYTTDGNLLLSFSSPTSIPGVGHVERTDVVVFTPSSTGTDTVGTFAMYIDGSDVGLDASGENISSIAVLGNSILMQTEGDFDAGGVVGGNLNIYQFTSTSLGATTSGSWSLYLNGTMAGFPVAPSAFTVLSDESVLVSFYNTTITVPNVGTVEDIDIVKFDPNPDGTGDYSLYFDGSDVGLKKRYFGIVGISVGPNNDLLLRFERKLSIGDTYTQPTKDIVLFTQTSLGEVTQGTFSEWFDGSDIGFHGIAPFDALAKLPNGNLALSFAADTYIENVGLVHPADVVEFFLPTELQPFGHFEMYLTRVAMGLSEYLDVESLSMGENGEFYAVINGRIYVDGESVGYNDVVRYIPSGDASPGTWSLFFDGSDVGLSGSSEIIDGIDVNNLTGDLYITVNNAFSVGGVSSGAFSEGLSGSMSEVTLSGGDADVYVCTMLQPGVNTQCMFEQYIDKDNIGFLNNSFKDFVITQ